MSIKLPDDLPTSNFGDDAWFSMLLPDKIATLKRLYAAIEKWREISKADFEAFQKECQAKHKPAWDRYNYDPVTDEVYMLLQTERAMLGSLAVSIASTAENFIYDICEHRRLQYKRNNKSDLVTATQSLSTEFGEEVTELPGYKGNQRARRLGNCFKHNGGKANEALVGKQGPVDVEIECEKEDWLQMIADTELILSEVIKRLKAKQKP